MVIADRYGVKGMHAIGGDCIHYALLLISKHAARRQAMSANQIATNRVYEVLRRAILEGEYLPATRLTAESVAQRHGVSRTPVRDVLWRLHAEGLVDIVANQGAFVANPSVAEMIEIYGLRATLEARAAELAAPMMTVGHVEELRRLAAGMEAAVASRAADRLVKLATDNDKFHKLIARVAGNRRLGACIASLTEVPSALKTFTGYAPAQLARSMHHHQDLISAFSERDPAWARAVMEAHILAARASYMTTSQRGDAGR
jgi:DNA-binding GntR family transcriptional regulator